jgi:ABC-type multidrug transport system fused ATPase/permease subunit
MPKKYFVFVFVTISLIQLILLSVLLTFASYASATEKAIPSEDIDVERFSSLINFTMTHVDQTRKAVEDGNSTEALRLLTVIRNDLTNIDGNVTDLIFSVSNIPP